MVKRLSLLALLLLCAVPSWAAGEFCVVQAASRTTNGTQAWTCAGTPAAGDMMYFRYQLDATGTTTAVATLHHVGFKMEYSITSRSD
jgi:hypothetical protein